jgi:hypothetical protein
MTFMKKLFSRYISILVVAAVFAACSDDDNTGDSTLTPTAPTVNITIEHPTVTLLEKDSSFGFTVTLTEPQIVDVAVYVEVSGGDATADEDFTYTSLITIPANRTTASGSVSIKADDIPEDTETLEITIGDTRTENAAITPAKMSFTILNEASTSLPLKLSWGGTAFDAAGSPIDATAIADMILLIVDATTGDVVDGADGAGFESYEVAAELEDGEYYVVAAIFGAMDIRDFTAIPTLDLTLEYSQAGVISPTTLEFPASYFVGAVCGENVYTMAKIVKTGSTYEVTRVAEGVETRDLSELEGNYQGSSGGAAVTITSGPRMDALRVSNFARTSNPVYLQSSVCVGDGELTIPMQSISVYNAVTGLAEIRFVSGTGTYAGNTIELNYTIVSETGAELTNATITYTLVPDPD